LTATKAAAHSTLPLTVMVILVVIALTILVLSLTSTTLLAQKLDKKDYAITDFGFLNSNVPFITVQGIAGGSYDATLGDEGYQAYVIKTNKGNFMITVAEGPGSSPSYSAERLLTNELKLNECLVTEQTQLEPRVWGRVIAFLGQDHGITSISDVYTIEVTSDDPDKSCITGDHVSRIFSHMTQ
jgi:hypothetical protein